MGVKRLTVVPAAAVMAAALVQPVAGAATALDWQGCGAEGFQCADLSVPLDYRRPGGQRIRVAMIRHPATDQGHRIGSLFFDPGGPGGSGVDMLPVIYQQFPAQVRERFDLIGIDPRGVGHSTALQCFDTFAEEEALFEDYPAGFPVGQDEQRKVEQINGQLDQACAERGGELMRHVSTADAARDLDLARQAVGDAGLNYLGLSYGTYLGATYANLFPGKVRAMTLDGNVDPEQWTKPSGLSTFMRMGGDQATARTIGQFLDLCGGAKNCAFSAGSPPATREKFETLLDRLTDEPVTVDGTTYTSALAASTVVGGMYAPNPVPGLAAGWQSLAQLLQSLWTGAGPAPKVKPVEQEQYQGLEQEYGVLCSESPNPRVPTAYEAQAAFAQGRAGLPGVQWAWDLEACAQWPAKAADGYYGPWNKPTANPILVIGNTFDPATPYEGAVAMSHELANARLLTVQGYGHTELINPSTCASEAESGYFVSGKLPKQGTVCVQDTTPF